MSAPAAAGLPARILVTGGTGFIGGHLVRRLCEEGVAVRMLCRAAPPGGLPAGAEVVRGDVTAPESLPPALEGVEAVAHLASALGATPLGPDGFHEVNARGTAHLLRAAREAKVARVVHGSSVGVIGPVAGDPAGEDAPCRPEDDYERSKLEGERAALRFAAEGLPVTVVRPTWVYGPGDRRTFKLIRAIARRRFFFVGAGETRQHPVYIDDLVEGIVRALAADLPPGEIVHLGGPEVVTIRHLCECIADAAGVSLPPLRVPREPLRTFAALFEAAFRAVGREAPLTRAKVDFFLKDRAYDTRKAARLLGFLPRTPIAVGIPLAVRWYRDAGWLSPGQPGLE